MPATIETDLKEVFGEFKQEFNKLNQRLDRIESNVTDLKVSQAEIRGEIKVLDEKVTGIGKRLENQGFLNWAILTALTVSSLLHFWSYKTETEEVCCFFLFQT